MLLDLPLDVLWAHTGEQHSTLFNEEFFQHSLTFSGTSIMSALQEYETGRFSACEFSCRNSLDNFKAIIGIITDVWHSQAHSSRCQSLQESFKQLILAFYVSED